tara:strand:+ start:17592 stop:18440 length:849 start_codon:yes stop_codon:yes gene_type:complete
MKKLGLLGQSIQHSISPILHEAAFTALNLEHSYKIWDIDKTDLESFIDEIKNTPIDGFNITIPYKESIMQYIDVIDPAAESIGAINTVINQDGILTGYNTDLHGIEQTFKLLSEDLTNKSIALIGSGGAAKSLVYYLNTIDIASLLIVNRSKERAQDLMENVSTKSHVTIHDLNQDASGIINNADVIINSTPFGMNGSSLANMLPPIDFRLSEDHIVFDLVYNPGMTPLLHLAETARCKYIGGLDMLVYQAAKAFEIWNKVYPDTEAMLHAGRQALKNEGSL